MHKCNTLKQFIFLQDYIEWSNNPVNISGVCDGNFLTFSWFHLTAKAIYFKDNIKHLEHMKKLGYHTLTRHHFKIEDRTRDLGNISEAACTGHSMHVTTVFCTLHISVLNWSGQNEDLYHKKLYVLHQSKIAYHTKNTICAALFYGDIFSQDLGLQENIEGLMYLNFGLQASVSQMKMNTFTFQQ